MQSVYNLGDAATSSGKGCRECGKNSLQDATSVKGQILEVTHVLFLMKECSFTSLSLTYIQPFLLPASVVCRRSQKATVNCNCLAISLNYNTKRHTLAKGPHNTSLPKPITPYYDVNLNCNTKDLSCPGLLICKYKIIVALSRNL